MVVWRSRRISTDKMICLYVDLGCGSSDFLRCICLCVVRVVCDFVLSVLFGLLCGRTRDNNVEQAATTTTTTTTTTTIQYR